MRQNWLVLVLPIGVMIGLFAFGFFMINQSEVVRNEELDSKIELDMMVEGHQELIITWDWSTLPEDGISGGGIIEVKFLNANNQAISFTPISSNLALFHGTDIIYSDEFPFTLEDRVLFAFPNKVEGSDIYGPIGKIKIELSDVEVDAETAIVRYYHFWDENKEFHFQVDESESVTDWFSSEHISKYWVVQRSTLIE